MFLYVYDPLIAPLFPNLTMQLHISYGFGNSYMQCNLILNTLYQEKTFNSSSVITFTIIIAF